MADNAITVCGNLTRAPELRYTPTGRAIASFGLAVNRRYQRDGEWVEEVSFFNAVAWATLGENAAASLDKGHRVVVTGRLTQRSWENDEGEKRSVVEIVCDDIGPSLKWAQAQIERNEREKPTNESRSEGAGTTGGGRLGSDENPYPDESEPF